MKRRVAAGVLVASVWACAAASQAMASTTVYGEFDPRFGDFYGVSVIGSPEPDHVSTALVAGGQVAITDPAGVFTRSPRVCAKITRTTVLCELGGNSVYVRLGPGDDSARLHHPTERYGRSYVQTGGGDDRVTVEVGDSEIKAGAGDDVIAAGAGKDEILGRTGDDRIDGGGGEDRVTGGVGDDRLAGGAGDDRLEGKAGADWYEGGPGADLLRAAEGAIDKAIDCGAGATDYAFIDRGESRLHRNCETWAVVTGEDVPPGVHQLEP